jgi:sarcosine oxidase
MSSLFDYIIIGGGSMGSATAYHLAKRGQRVLLLEQFDFVHELGAHGGQSRLIRKAYFEHPDYVPLLQRAYENWASLEAETNEKVYFETGIVYFGEPNDGLLANIRHSAKTHDLKLEDWDLAQAKRQYPMFDNIPDDWECLFEPEAGFLLVEKCVRLYLKQALQHGAIVRAHERVYSWKVPEYKEEGSNKYEVVVRTNKGIYGAKKIIFTAGAWTNELLQELNIPLKVTRQILGWVRPQNWSDFTLGKFPCWAVSDKEYELYYGMPILDEEDSSGAMGLKLGCHLHGLAVDPNTVRRTTNHLDEVTFRRGLEKYMPTANGDLLAMKTCLYTNSPDGHFIIDRHPQHEEVIFACGFSGHGFKFASVIGEILADLAIDGETKQPIDFLKLDRLL